MIFNRTRSPIIYTYNFQGGFVLFRADNYVIDLAYKFLNSINPISHVNMIRCKELKILEFVMKLTKGFTRFQVSFGNSIIIAIL